MPDKLRRKLGEINLSANVRVILYQTSRTMLESEISVLDGYETRSLPMENVTERWLKPQDPALIVLMIFLAKNLNETGVAELIEREIASRSRNAPLN